MTAMSSARAAPQQILAWLHEVADPEIPVLSVVDLGLVREIFWQEESCVVVITPTYSGCPAMQEIVRDMEAALRARGVPARVHTRLAPAWSTDWITERGRAALQAFGIAPPARRASVDAGRTLDISALRRADAETVPCPHCHAQHTRLISQFASTACKALYRCMACGEPFDYFKPH